MENKLFLELEFATDIGISLAGASSWQSRVVMAGRGEGWWGMSACQDSKRMIHIRALHLFHPKRY